MPTLHRPPALTLALTALALAGCAASRAPIAPAEPSGATYLPAIPLAADRDAAPGLATLGLFDFTLDPATATFDLSPMRSATALGDPFALDLTTAFTTTKFGCADCLAVDRVEYIPSATPPRLTVDFTVRHPFREFNTAGRADLHVNNVRLVYLVNGTDSFFSGSIRGDAALLTNPDGYTTLPATFVTPPPGLTSTVFPFQVFQTGNNALNPSGNFDANAGWSAVLNNPSGFNVLRMGGEAQQTASFIIEPGDTGVINGSLALLANFVVSTATFVDRPNPTYFMPEGAMPEAWRTSALAPVGLTSEGTDQPGNVLVSVTDWQAGGLVDPSFPNATNPFGLRTSGDVADVVVSIPAFGAPTAPVTTPTSGSGSYSDPWLYSIAVTKPASLTTPGTYRGLAKIRDVRTPFNALNKSLDVATGLSFLTELATYIPFEITIAEHTGGYTPPVLGPATPFGPSQVTNDQPSGTNLFTDTVSSIIDSRNDTVVMVLKKQAADFKAFAVASADGGSTWGTPIPLDPAATGGGTTSYRGIAIAINADATCAYVAGSEFSGGEPVIARLNISGNTLTLDAQIQGISLNSLIGPTSTTFEIAIIGDRTDPEVFYVGGDDADGTVGTRRFVVAQVANAKSATTSGQLAITGIGGTANGVAWTTDPAYTRVDDPCFATGSDGDLFLTFDPGRAGIDPGVFVHWDKQSNTFSAPVIFDGLIDAKYGDFSGSRVGVGPDGRPVICYAEATSDAVVVMKAALTAAPWNFTDPVAVDPDYDKMVQGLQQYPDMAVDSTTGRIHIVVGDYRDQPTESTPGPPILASLFESIFEPDLTLTIDGRKLDDPGTGDNTDGDRCVRIHIVQNGTPTTKKWLYFWQDADARNPAVGPDVLLRVGL